MFIGQLSLPGRFLKFLFRGNIQIFRNQNEFLCILGPKVFDFKGIFGATMRKGICYDFRSRVDAKACFSTIMLCTCLFHTTYIDTNLDHFEDLQGQITKGTTHHLYISRTFDKAHGLFLSQDAILLALEF